MTEEDLNWSLKGKKETGYGMCIAPPEIYLADDIETLRQKLISDFESWIDGSDNDVTDSQIEIMIKIINRRFGYEEI